MLLISSSRKPLGIWNEKNRLFHGLVFKFINKIFYNELISNSPQNGSVFQWQHLSAGKTIDSVVQLARAGQMTSSQVSVGPESLSRKDFLI